MSTPEDPKQDPHPDPGIRSENPETANTEELEEAAPTPFDHPLFLPILLAGLTLWFGYDGFLNDDPDMLEHVTFNRVGFGLLLCGAIYYGIQAYREWGEDDGRGD